MGAAKPARNRRPSPIPKGFEHQNSGDAYGRKQLVRIPLMPKGEGPPPIPFSRTRSSLYGLQIAPEGIITALTAVALVASFTASENSRCAALCLLL